MARKASYLLESELPSKAFFYLLCNKDGLTGYGLAKLVYGVGFFSPVKIYDILKKLKAEKLITSEETIIKGKRSNMIRPVMFEFLKVLNERKLPEEHRLTDAELKTLSEFSDKKIIWKNVLQMNFNEVTDLSLMKEEPLNILDAVAAVLKTGVSMSSALKENKARSRAFTKKAGAVNVFTNVLTFFQDFAAIPAPISEKLQHLIIPKPMSNLLVFAQAVAKQFF